MKISKTKKSWKSLDWIQTINKSEFIEENIDETIFMFALFKCRKSDKGRN